MTRQRFFATTPRGFEDLLAAELAAFGAVSVRPGAGGVRFSGTLETGYRACLESRLAEHVLLQIHQFRADDPDALYEGIRQVLWREHLGVGDTFVVDVTSRHPAFEHTHYAALRVKDAIVDQFREATGERPSVNVAAPDVRIHIHAARDAVSVSIDLAGDGLHRRGYRARSGPAPVKETLAAGILMRAGWPEVFSRGGALVDPMCGGGTFLIEAAWMALNVAPSNLRQQFGFSRWRKHDAGLFRRLRNERLSPRDDAAVLLIEGYDNDERAIVAARENIARAGISEWVHLEQRGLDDLAPPPVTVPGLVVTNPPYGVRMSDPGALEPAYAALGGRLKSTFPGWRAAILAGEDAPTRALGLRAERSHRVNNGPLRCQLLRYQIHPAGTDQATDRPSAEMPKTTGIDATAFANRLQKNLRTLGRWAKRNDIRCFRVYDADVPEFAVAVDVYQSDELWIHVQEYAPPSTVDVRAARLRLRAVVETLPDVLQVSPQRVVLKRRRRQRGKTQYERLNESEEFIVVEEDQCRVLVNLKDRIDTGLYLDHRTTRTMIREMARGKAFLNLYAYTGVASVHAAAGGAENTLSVDMSSTYVAWAKRNFALNDLDPSRHKLVRADCSEWIQQASDATFDLIYMDPPTFSNSKRMRGSLDIQRDYAGLIKKAMRLLRPDGILLFSNHAKRFRMDKDALSQFDVLDISKQTVPKDFARRPNIHHCWRVTHRHA